MMRPHRFTFSLAITGISRVLIARDRLLGRIPAAPIMDAASFTTTRHWIESGNTRLDSVFAAPIAPSQQFAVRKPVVLICHGIGEVVEHWAAAQQLLAAHWVASLVFDYSGYGRSRGRIDAEQCEQDAIAAFHYLQTLAPGSPVIVLGLSLGTGVAAAIVRRVPAAGLVLCAGFPSFRKAAHSVGVPAFLSPLVPPLWEAQKSLRGCSLPVLVIHGKKDRLFPPRMASELAACCGPQAELMLVPEISHADPYYRPSLPFWGPILAWMSAGNIRV